MAYRMSFACLTCCKAFKRVVWIRKIPQRLTCPHCGGDAYNFGRHFKAPRQHDARRWNTIRFLVEHGFRFQKIRTGPGSRNIAPYPGTIEEARAFVIEHRAHALPPISGDDGE